MPTRSGNVAKIEGAKTRKARKPMGPRTFFVTYNDEGPLEIFPSGQAARLLAIVSNAAERGEIVQYKKLAMVQKVDLSSMKQAGPDDEDEDEDEDE